MENFLIEDLAKITRAHPVSRASSFTGVSIDSRTVKAGDCFFAIVGDNFDGHDFVADAFDAGAACAVVTKDIDSEKFADKTILKVDDTVKALGRLAAEYRRCSDFKVVAITGSTGKTTTRQMASYVLSRHWSIFQSPKNFNNAIGLPLTLLGAGGDDEIIIAELASSYPGEIAYLTDIARPDIALVTNVYPAHLIGFGDIETITQEKLSISQGLSTDGVLIINADFESLVAAAAGTRFTTFGKSNAADIQAKNITYNGFNSSFIIDDTDIRLPLPGPGNVENALAAWAICRQLGISIEDFAAALRTLPPIPMRAELMQLGTLVVLNDCYNANPASMKNALDILVKLGSGENRRLVFICGDMAELADKAEQLHAELGTFIAGAGVNLLLAAGSFAEITAAAAKKAADYHLQTECFEDTLSLCNNLDKIINDFDIILVKGSRVAGLEKAVEKLKELFS